MQLVTKQQQATVDNSYVRHALFSAMAVSVLTIFMPTVGLCKSMGQVWPLVLMAGVVTAGTILGLLLHKKLEHDEAVQTSFARVPNVPKNDMDRDFKKAA